MIDLPKYLMQTHREPVQERRERNQQRPSQPLIPSPHSSTEVPTSSPPVKILQPTFENNLLQSNVHLDNVVQPNERANTDQQGDATENEPKISVSAALLTTVLYVCCISLVVYGAIHFKDCPAENMIAISYIVMGCLMLFSRILSSPEECRDIFKKEKTTAFVAHTCFRLCLNLIIQIVVMCFFCAVCYWAFHINPDTDEKSSNYCEKGFYKNTYYGCIVGLSLLGLIFFVTCCGICIVVSRSV